MGGRAPAGHLGPATGLSGTHSMKNLNFLGNAFIFLPFQTNSQLFAMPLQRALQCFLYKMLHFKIIQGEEQFHRMMENPLDEALKTQMLWNWRHGCTEGFDLLGVSRECEKLPT